MFFKLPEKKEGAAPKKAWIKWLYLAAIFFILADIIAASYLLFEKIYQNRIYPNVFVGNIDLSGMNPEEAQKILNKKIDEINQAGFKFNNDQDELVLLPIISSFDGDLTKEVVSFKTDETVKAAYLLGRNHEFFDNLKNKLELLLKGDRHLDFIFETADNDIKKILSTKFWIYEQPGSDAELLATTTPNYFKKEIFFKIKEEKPGYRFDYNLALSELKKQIKKLDNTSKISISSVQEYPDIKKNECQNIEAQANQFLEQAELTLTFENKKWPIDKDSIANWLTMSRGTEGKIVLDLNSEKIKAFLSEKISPSITIKPSNARFEIKDNRVIEFASSIDGRKINEIQTISNLRTNFLTNNEKTLELTTEIAKSNIKTESLNSLGIKEIIGIGHSNFAGSPKNRIHNIKTGATAINGTLVAPGEEFSTVEALGEVTGETGYLKEMTIKGDKTIAEYGGGLCQVGTTLFRSAMASGFPITARRPHSYRVGYYEPAGTDAAIYGPYPDLRFINDSKDYILIQSRIDGNDIYFDFWGTKDGRTIEKSDPVVYNIVKPQPTKTIETTDLPVGQKKCTERAHNGADAYFDYKVTYSDNTVKETRFKSHYVPWQEVCLIGVEKKATSTPAVAQ
jgi:vancomycin resistance protein YoaR